MSLSRLFQLPEPWHTDLVEAEAVTPDTPGGQYVGAIVYRNARSEITVQCSAVALTPRIILTAAHCFSSIDCLTNEVEAGHQTFYFQQADRALTLEGAFKLESWRCHRGWRPRQSCAADLAVAYLEQDLPLASVAGLGSLRAVSPEHPLIKVGFGYFRKRGKEDEPILPGLKATTIFRYRDQQQAAGVFSYSSSTPTGKPRKICRGDSGGPSFQQLDGTLSIVGITSRFETVSRDKRPLCGETGYDADVGQYLADIETLVAQPIEVDNHCR